MSPSSFTRPLRFRPASTNHSRYRLFTLVMYADSPHPQQMFCPAYCMLHSATATHAPSTIPDPTFNTITSAQTSEDDVPTKATPAALFQPNSFFRSADDTLELALFQNLCLPPEPPRGNTLQLLLLLHKGTHVLEFAFLAFPRVTSNNFKIFSSSYSMKEKLRKLNILSATPSHQ